MRVSVANGSSVHTTHKTDRVGSLQGTGPDGGPAELSVQLLGSMVHSQFPELISVVNLVRDNKLLFVVTYDAASPGHARCALHHASDSLTLPSPLLGVPIQNDVPTLSFASPRADHYAHRHCLKRRAHH